MSIHELRAELVRGLSDDELSGLLDTLFPDSILHAQCREEALRRCK